MSTLSAGSFYEQGSQFFKISLGVDFPVTNSYYKDNKFTTTVGMGEKGTHISLGGIGSLDYEAFVIPQLAIGGAIGYQFNYTEAGSVFTQVPMLFKITYVPIQGKFELPISLGVGFNYLSYQNASNFTFMANLSIGATYFFTSDWGIGIDTSFSVVPELYSSKPNKNGIATFIPLTLSATYRH